ncbi:MAG: adenylosuccinate lyase [Elusimicrobia bacterium]|nr:adenylosuccinate lyase [Elusimicrobiota bacterium]
MIERYTRPEMAGIWSQESRYRKMLEVEVVFLEALARHKRIPRPQIGALRRLASRPLSERVRRAEARNAHEIVALLEVLSAGVGRRASAVDRYLHYGLTSSDIMDTVLALQLSQACDLLLEGLGQVAGAVRVLARRHAKTWMAGRTHGVHAEPITFGIKLAGWHAEIVRDLERLRRARDVIRYGKLSGAVGTFSHVSPAVEAAVLRRFGLKPEPLGTQVVPRDRHADFFHALVLTATSIERFAVEIRHLQRTEVLEVEEPFGKDQKGSSAMPHKRNPILCENLCGLARMIRSYESAIVENAALWHERDITHSSVERVVFSDASILLDFMLHRFLAVVRGLQVYPRRMKENLESSRGLAFSQRVLLRLIDRGLGRLEAYELVQRNAMKCWKNGGNFCDVLGADPDVRRVLSVRDIRACFDLDGYGASTRVLFQRAGIL